MAEPVPPPRPLGPPGRGGTDAHGRTWDGRKPGEARALSTERGPEGWGVVEEAGYRDKRGDWNWTTFWVDAVRFETQDAANTHLESVAADDEKILCEERGR